MGDLYFLRLFKVIHSKYGNFGFRKIGLAFAMKHRSLPHHSTEIPDSNSRIQK